jgi:hypothetical protein
MPAATKDLARKLGIRPGMLVALLNPPAEAEGAIRACAPSGVRWKRRLGSSRFDLIIFWPMKAAGLRREFARLQAALAADGAIWAVMPKRAHAAARGIAFSWEEMQAEGLLGDQVDNKVAAITATDYGTRFVIRKERRRQ